MRIRKSKYLLVVFLLTVTNGIFAQKATLLPPGNANFSSLEKNILFYADNRFTVSQTGSAQVYAPAMFDGDYRPSYTLTAPSVSDPTVITIENLPLEHTQRGAYVGWTTRYWPATKFKIEGFTGDNVWTTIADESNYGGFEYLSPIDGVFSKLRFSFYAASGDGGRMGMSELFFLHSEAAQAYDGLMVKYNHDGNVGIGMLNPTAKLHVNGTGIIVNPEGGNYNENLRLPVANDDYACIALGTDNNSFGTVTGQWSLVRNPITMNNRFSIRHMNDELFSMQTNGNVGLGVTSPTNRLEVNGTIRTKKVLVTQTGWPDYVFDSSYQLPSLDSVADFIQTNKHLPDMPSAAIVEKDGHDLGEVQKQLLKKVEELTLYVIELKKENGEMKSKIDKLEKTRIENYNK